MFRNRHSMKEGPVVRFFSCFTLLSPLIVSVCEFVGLTHAEMRVWCHPEQYTVCVSPGWAIRLQCWVTSTPDGSSIVFMSGLVSPLLQSLALNVIYVTYIKLNWAQQIIWIQPYIIILKLNSGNSGNGWKWSSCVSQARTVKPYTSTNPLWEKRGCATQRTAEPISSR